MCQSHQIDSDCRRSHPTGTARIHLGSVIFSKWNEEDLVQYSKKKNEKHQHQVRYFLEWTSHYHDFEQQFRKLIWLGNMRNLCSDWRTTCAAVDYTAPNPHHMSTWQECCWASSPCTVLHTRRESGTGNLNGFYDFLGPEQSNYDITR